MNWSKFFFCTGAVLCLPLFVYFCIFNIDPATGFFVQKGFLTVFYYAVLTLCLAGETVAGLGGKNIPAFRPGKKPLLGGIALIFALLAAAQGGIQLRDYLGFVFSFSNPMDAIVFQPSSLVINLALLAVSLLGVFGFLLLGMAYFKGKEIGGSPLALFGPPVWIGVFTVQMFMAYPQIASFPDRALWFTCLVFFTLFSVGQSRILLGIQTEKGCRWAAAFGLCCSLTGFILAGGTVLSLRIHTTLPWFHLMFAPLAALYALLFLTSGQKDPKETPSPAEPAE